MIFSRLTLRYSAQVKHELGSAARHYNFNASSDARSIFRYRMHTLRTR